MKTKVITLVADLEHDQWKKDEKGYIDGYLLNYRGHSCAIVIIDNDLKTIPIGILKVIQ